MTPNSGRQTLNALPSGTVLHDYIIDSELGSGGFSMVYLARHRLNPDWMFAIKEYFPRELVARDNDAANVRPVNTGAHDAFDDGLRRFRDEAQQLRRFRNERYIVSCLNYFEANGTAYLVMDYDDGLPLSEFLRQREVAGRPFTEADLRAVIEPLLEGLQVVHRAGVLHRDIKPGNVFVRRPDDIAGHPAQPVLIDFGAAKQNYLARHSRSQAPYTPGYAAYEQISSEGDIGPWTDIYAVGALMWRIVAGGCLGDQRLFVPAGADETDGAGVWSPTPRPAEKRAYALHRGRPDPMKSAAELGARRFSPQVLKATDKCLALYPEDRVEDCFKLSELLDGRSGQYRVPSRREGVSRAPGSAQTDSRGPGTPPKAAETVGSNGAPFMELLWWGLVALGLVYGAILILAASPDPMSLADELSSGGQGPELVAIPAGRFQMGCVSGLDCSDNELPVHDVTIPQPFAVSKFEVTFEDWDRCVAGGGCDGYRPDGRGWGRASRPVIDVSWNNAQRYVMWLSEQTHAEYRLLSEAEWEYAARAGTATAYSWGNSIGRNRANCSNCRVRRQTTASVAPVGSFQANAWGVHDMHGNVAEWVEDCARDGYTGAPSDGSVWQSGNCSARVIRGGFWGLPARDMRSASRSSDSSTLRIGFVGFRVARTLAP